MVGAGSAGSILAERLSGDPSFRVVLIEAGPASSADEEGVRDGYRLPIGPDSPVATYYWATLTSTGDQAELVRGAVVGGSGAINGGYFVRGRPADFDGWAVPGWSWADVREHFRVIETDRDFRDDPLHGSSGPIPIGRKHEQSSAGKELTDRAVKNGYPVVADLNGTADVGVGLVPLNIDSGVRVGPGRAYLEGAGWRPNLAVYSGTRVLRVLCSGGRAIGVEVAVGSSVRTLTADRIILSAGAIESAKLLLVSGLGPADDLRAVGVQPVVDLPGVGTRVMDHPEWVLDTGEEGQPGYPVLDTVLHTDRQMGIEIRPYTTGFAAMAGVRVDDLDARQIGVALMTPQCRGRVELRSADPHAPVYIDLRYDSQTADMDRLRDGVRLVSELYGRRFSGPRWSTSQHLCGTAPMGGDDDKYAVVDKYCRVRGIDGLFVIDGSIMPTIPSRGPAATIAMIGHRTAQFVAWS
ncbi:MULTISPECIES: mycofactocin system GMC family oxidoreductase MftG [unclassified Mycobacteroides]|uniref:mycofactocin dehydrogenase MftG n=1 Tax=unclassified Mycobacteroides TaxID=2618759 RepID=UPI002815BD95|nr:MULTISPECIES: mycofactocin system GMC family oxidoreductase MftG [unclassified Mycobacteroides]